MRSITPFTLVMAYYENAQMLQEHYRLWSKWKSSVLEYMHVIVVDDGSPKYPAEPPIGRIPALTLQIWRMKKDIRWNQDACRNVGVTHAEQDWVLLTDMDHVVCESVACYLITHAFDPTIAYTFRRVSAPDMVPYKPHPNSWFMSRKLFDDVGGYDERFAGLYGTDADFRDRLKAKAEIVELKQALVRVPRYVVADASTTTYLRKQPEDRAGIKRIRAERDLIDGWQPLRGTQEYERVY